MCFVRYKPPHWVMDNQDQVPEKSPEKDIYLATWILSQRKAGVPWAQGFISTLQDGCMKTFINRLDKDTSGVVVLPRSHHAWVSLKNSLQNKSWSKKYFCLCWGEPPARQGPAAAGIWQISRQRNTATDDGSRTDGALRVSESLGAGAGFPAPPLR